jgi:Tfp pilus assembly protein PilO
MSRSFKLAEQDWKDPQVQVRLGLGVLLLANLVAAAFAFHWIGESPEALTRRLGSERARLKSLQAKRDQSKVIAAHMETAKGEGDQFLENWITGRRHTYSSIIGEITESAKGSGMKMLDTSIAPLDPIEGSADLELMTITVNFEGAYPQLMKLVNSIDRSQRLFIIESLQVAPQPRGDLLNVSLKLYTIVKDENEAGAL